MQSKINQITRNQTTRNQWVQALTAHPPKLIIELVQRIGHEWEISYETLPQNGLSLLQVQDSVFHEPYYLGEIPLANAWVLLTAPNGQSWQGAAQVMSDFPDLASSLAICDAILANQLSGWQQVQELVEKGMIIRQEENRRRGAMLETTRVNFSLLSQEESDDPD